MQHTLIPSHVQIANRHPKRETWQVYVGRVLVWCNIGQGKKTTTINNKHSSGFELMSA